jgi:antitoxin VapB
MKPRISTPSNDEARQVRLFRNGANQAIRIPREFELQGTEVTIRRVAGTLVIEPVQQQHPKGSPAALLAALATLEPIAEPFANVDHGLQPLDDVAL